MRVIILGLDGATFDLIKPWVKEGKLPTFRRIMEGGAYGELMSTIPPFTSPAWQCLCSGKRPDTLRVYDFFKFDPDQKKLFVTHRDKLGHQFFWEILTESSYFPFIINVPMTYPPQEKDNMIITGLGSPKDTCFPKELAESIEGKYRIDPINYGDKKNLRVYRRKVFKNTEELHKLIKHLFREYEWNLFFAVSSGTDQIQHKFWHNSSEMLKMYMKMDELLQWILKKKRKEDYLFILSDHGFGPTKKLFHVNNWLIERGYLKLKRSKKRSLFSKVGISRDDIHRLLSKLKVAGIVERLVPKKVIRKVPRKGGKMCIEEAINSSLIDWEHTLAFSTGNGEIITKNKEVRDKLTKELIEYSKEKNIKIDIIFPKAKGKDIPDLLLSIEDYAFKDTGGYLGHGKVIEEVPDWDQNGTHRVNGIFIAYGPDIKENKEISAEIIDIAPTILHMFNLLIPSDMDGRVLKEIFEKDSEVAKREMSYQEVREKNRLKRRIKELKSKKEI
jgi:predicted AlkP superfamily phosphohydrolase/phosphomutase